MTYQMHDLEQAGLTIPYVLKTSKLLIPYRLFQVKRDWKRVMGDAIAKYSFIQDIDGHTVILGVLNPIWMNELYIQQNRLIQKINEEIGEDFVTAIRFVKSGKKPVRPNVSILDDDEEEIPISLQNVVLPTKYVASVKKYANQYEPPLRDKIEKLLFAKEKKRLAIEQSGRKKCPRCGRWLKKGETLCLFCRLGERQHKKQLTYDLLIQAPWLSWQEFQQEMGLTTDIPTYHELYDEVRRDCIYKLIEKVRYESDMEEDDLFLALFITRKKPFELTDDHIRNLVKLYKPKKEGREKKET